MLLRIESRLKSQTHRLLLLTSILSALALFSMSQGGSPRWILSSASDPQRTGEDGGLSASEAEDTSAPPGIVARDAFALEGTSVTTTVSVELRLSAPSESNVTATYQTTDGTAAAPSDYVSESGSAVITAGQTTTVVEVEVTGDSDEESDERFYIDLLGADGATITDGRGGVSILDDDGANEGRTLPEDPGQAVPVDSQAPTITITTPNEQAAATGWYNQATSGTDGVDVSVTATDVSGVVSLVCKKGSATLLSSSESGEFTLGDGVHQISCTATDGEGNRGAGPSSTPMPATFKVDQALPSLECTAKPKFILNQPSARVPAAVTDVTSGAAANPATAPADTSKVGQELSANVTGSDLAGNEASITCLFAVVYRFSGFEQPLGSPGPQEEQAGRTIPVKWRISDYFDIGVEDIASFKSLTTFSDDCSTTRSAETSEASPGISDLKYQGDGRYHFNWKTPKSYSGRCRTMSLNLLDGESDRLAFISFR